MRTIKVIGAIIGILLLTILIPIALGIISRSLIAMLAVLAVGIVALGISMRNRLDSLWSSRMRDRSTPQNNNRFKQEIDNTRRQAREPRRRRDAE
jgi:O-antigen ligase